MTAKDRLLVALTAGPACDGCLGRRSAVEPVQTVNQTMRGLASAGGVVRAPSTCPTCGGAKLVNSLPTGAAAAVLPALPVATHTEVERPWYWEGHVQHRLVEHLVREGYRILRSANTASRERGVDIEAESDGQLLWISVKGFPTSSRHVQARHWFAGAVLDLVLYRERRKDVNLALGLPAGFKTYEKLAGRVTWLRASTPFLIFWVDDRGRVTRA